LEVLGVGGDGRLATRFQTDPERPDLWSDWTTLGETQLKSPLAADLDENGSMNLAALAPDSSVLGAERPALASQTIVDPVAGDCNGDGVVTEAEVTKCPAIFLGTVPLSDCESCDANHDGVVDAFDFQTAVNNFLNRGLRPCAGDC